ncbi:MAG: thymidine phosphorylase [Fimbriimonadales bacterium]|nr:thymidine phosphorylase [Fimbriimonadales bacterium]
MDIHDFIKTKRDGHRHTARQLHDFVTAVTKATITDYQISAWLMAAYINGLDDTETADLTAAMAASGDSVSFGDLPRPIVDKHSTGGVGDTATFLLLPLLASVGLISVKMSGRGLGFTGGTIDKVAAIDGFRTDLSPHELRQTAKEVGCALGGQSASLAPADKKLYALRDATETVSSLPLIAASIMSKKLAVESDGIVLDVKCGSGAFMKTPSEARALANKLVSIGKAAGRRTSALITDMSQPLNRFVGNALEIRGALESLDAGLKDRLGSLVLAIAKEVARLADASVDFESTIASGKVRDKLNQWVAAQEGNLKTPLPVAPVVDTVYSDKSGFVESIDCAAIGETARFLGAGRMAAEDEIDLAVGIEMKVLIGDKIQQGDPLCDIHCRTESALEVAQERMHLAIQISQNRPQISDILIDTVT